VVYASGTTVTIRTSHLVEQASGERPQQIVVEAILWTWSSQSLLRSTPRQKIQVLKAGGCVDVW